MPMWQAYDLKEDRQNFAGLRVSLQFLREVTDIGWGSVKMRWGSMQWAQIGFLVGLGAVLTVGGCTPPPPPTLEIAMYTEKLQAEINLIKVQKGCPTFSDWESCAHALEYLLKLDDPDAKEFSIRVLPRIAEMDIVLDRAILNLGYDSYDGWESLHQILVTMPLVDQVYIVRLLDHLDPADWHPGEGDQVRILAANPALQAAYAAAQASNSMLELDPRAGE